MWVGLVACCVAFTAIDTAPAEITPPATSWGRHAQQSWGMVPLWEDTGELLPEHGVYVGMETVTGSPLAGVQVSVSPNYFVHRVPNVDLKLRLYADDRVRVAWRQGVLVLFRNAQDRFFFSAYASRIFNPKSELVLLPSNLSCTYGPWPFLRLHATVTMLPQIFTFPKERGLHVWAGLSLLVEVIFFPGQSLMLHAGEVGLWEHEFSYLGASYRFNYAWFVARAGYAYRVYPEGLQTSPFVALGAQW